MLRNRRYSSELERFSSSLLCVVPVRIALIKYYIFAILNPTLFK